jgi:hypothetical protein
MHHLILRAAGGALFATMLAASAPAGAGEQPSVHGQRTVEEITERIALKDCEGAVADLKRALRKGFPEVALLAGSMYDNGVCVTRDWERAVPFYIQAWQDGLPKGAYRLAAGYASPDNGDVAAALWWASRLRDRGFRAQGVASCEVSPAVRDDPERFTAELQTWPQARLAVCNYLTGVMATMSGEGKYPSQAAHTAVGGTVGLRFLPGVPRIELTRGRVSEHALAGLVDGDRAQERGTRSAGGFEKALREVADRALRRYPQAPGIPADAVLETDYVFEVQYE